MASTTRWQKAAASIIQERSKGSIASVFSLEDEEEEEEQQHQHKRLKRKFCFEYPEDKQLRRNRQQGLIEQLVAVEIDINDVAEKDDDDISQQVCSMVSDILNSVYFKGMIFMVIAINAVHIALQTVESISIPYSYIFYFVDNLIMGIFICEIVIKWYSGFIIFWKDYWNIMDFVIIFVLHLGPWLAFFSNTRLLRILRVIRAFRSLKTVTSLTGLSLVVETILQSIPDMANIMMLLFIFMIVLSVVGVKLFGKFVPKYFGSPTQCMFSIFVCFTQDGWMQIFRNFERYAEADKFTYVSACLFFILTILMAAFIIANLIVAVVTTNLDRAMKEMKEEQKHLKESLVSGIDEKPEESNNKHDGHVHIEEDLIDVPLVYMDKILEECDLLKPKHPLFKCDLSFLTTEKLENYYLLLIALDENIKENIQLRKTIFESVEAVRSINKDKNVDAETTKLLYGYRHSLSSYEEVVVSNEPEMVAPDQLITFGPNRKPQTDAKVADKGTTEVNL